MTWNYRIIKRKDKETDDEWYGLNEVFYNRDGSLMAYSETDEVVSDSPEGIIKVLNMMLKDTKKDRPILTEEDFKKEKK